MFWLIYLFNVLMHEYTIVDNYLVVYNYLVWRYIILISFNLNTYINHFIAWARELCRDGNGRGSHNHLATLCLTRSVFSKPSKTTHDSKSWLARESCEKACCLFLYFFPLLATHNSGPDEEGSEDIPFSSDHKHILDKEAALTHLSVPIHSVRGC